MNNCCTTICDDEITRPEERKSRSWNYFLTDFFFLTAGFLTAVFFAEAAFFRGVSTAVLFFAAFFLGSASVFGLNVLLLAPHPFFLVSGVFAACSGISSSVLDL